MFAETALEIQVVKRSSRLVSVQNVSFTSFEIFYFSWPIQHRLETP